MIQKSVRKWLYLAASSMLLGACSGSNEDVRVTFCKDISRALVSNADSIEWLENENTFRRPEYATAKLNFEFADSDGRKTAMQTECYFEYDALEDTAQHLADPFSAYATLPFAMAVDGRMLPDAQVARLRSKEQVRRGYAAIDKIESGARELADKIRSGIGQ